jgi:hypothetical protein
MRECRGTYNAISPVRFRPREAEREVLRLRDPATQPRDFSLDQREFDGHLLDRLEHPRHLGLGRLRS